VFSLEQSDSNAIRNTVIAGVLVLVATLLGTWLFNKVTDTPAQLVASRPSWSGTCNSLSICAGTATFNVTNTGKEPAVRCGGVVTNGQNQYNVGSQPGVPPGTTQPFMVTGVYLRDNPTTLKMWAVCDGKTSTTAGLRQSKPVPLLRF
jgi:hypothetical protein